MSTITIPFVKPGDTVTWDKYELETIPEIANQDIEATNVRTEAYHKPHFFGNDPGTVLRNRIVSSSVNTSPNYLSSGSFAQWYGLAHTPSPAYILEVGHVLRLHATINIRDHFTIAGNKGEFEFAYYWDVGAGYVQIPGSTTFRYSAAPLDRDGAAPWDPKQNYRVGFSYCKPIATQVTLSGVRLYYRMIDPWDVWADYSVSTLFTFRN